MSVAFNTAIVPDQIERAVQLHEDAVNAYQAGRAAEAESLFRAALDGGRVIETAERVIETGSAGGWPADLRIARLAHQARRLRSRRGSMRSRHVAAVLQEKQFGE
jgi:hypothetical protein